MPSIHPAKIVFRKIPVKVTVYGNILLYNLTISDPNECATVAGPNANATIIKYFQDKGYCEIYNGGLSYSLSTSWYAVTGKAAYTQYVRSRGMCSCADGTDGERALIDFVYYENACIPAYDFAYDKATNYCVGQSSAQGVSDNYANGYGLWRTGATSNYTLFYMTRAQATQMTKYTCTAVVSYRVPFGDTWYCMSLAAVTPNNFSLWSDNYCGQVLTDGYGVKFVHPLVYGFVYVFSQAKGVTGLTTYDGSTYVYNDNSTVPSNLTLPWASGYPKGNPYVFVTKQMTLQDSNTNTGNYLNCMGPVQLR
ncbi:unnamed protein product [Bursaphelenchus xylophilus]|uniref:(pine wood nematode) hypothetical protein n=1 Tax=Bursaphelenchus xylophilus TaxID=6326 RepID=A0A1I7RU72_BURXY|nr:unnamed protein product [Bursaphelenchus xylophilus]CAG9113883.1 unnamed protein product [Bursaphelenchus xylophilus]